MCPRRLSPNRRKVNFSGLFRIRRDILARALSVRASCTSGNLTISGLPSVVVVNGVWLQFCTKLVFGFINCGSSSNECTPAIRFRDCCRQPVSSNRISLSDAAPRRCRHKRCFLCESAADGVEHRNHGARHDFFEFRNIARFAHFVPFFNHAALFQTRHLERYRHAFSDGHNRSVMSLAELEGLGCQAIAVFTLMVSVHSVAVCSRAPLAIAQRVFRVIKFLSP